MIKKTATFIFILPFGALYFIYSFRPNWDIDIYWHIKTGEWIIENLRIPHTDIFSAIDPQREWTPFQWLYEVIVYLVDHFLGFTAVRALHAVVLLAAFYLFFMFLKRYFAEKRFPHEMAKQEGGLSLFAPVLFIFFLFMVLFEDRIRVRPHVFNLLFEVLFLKVWFGGWENFFERRPDSSTLRSLNLRKFFPYLLVAAFWANIHAGGAVILPVSFLTISISRFLKERILRVHGEKTNANSAGAFICFVLLTAVMVVMPGFVKGVITAFSMYRESYLLIPEWLPSILYLDPRIAGTTTPHHYVCAVTPYAATFALGFFLIVRLIKDGLAGLLRKEDISLIALLCLFSYLSIKSSRFVYLSVIPVIFLMGRIRPASVRKLLTSLLIVGAIVLFLVSYHYSIVFQRGSIGRAISMLAFDHEPGEFPEKAAEFMEEAKLEGGIFHLVRWGGFLLYKLYPKCTVFTDGRGNFTAEDREVLIESHKPLTRKEVLEKVFTDYTLDFVIFPAPVFPLYNWDKEKWMLIYRDFNVEVFLRKNERNRKNIEKTRIYYFPQTSAMTDEGLENGIIAKASYDFLSREEIKKRIAKLLENPDEPESAKNLGLIYFASGDYKTASRYFKSAIEKRPKDPINLLYHIWSSYLTEDFGAVKMYLQSLKTAKLGLPYMEKEIAALLIKELEKM